jgi:hypothetical protein
MGAIENGHAQGFHPPAVGQDVGWMRGDEGSDALGPLEFASHPQDQGQMGDGRQATHGNRHDEPP